MASTTHYIDVRDAHFEYHTPVGLWQLIGGKQKETVSALRSVSFRLPLNVHATLFGHEGSGKTTLLRLLAGAIKPTKGSLRVMGRLPTEIKHIAAGYVSAEELNPPAESCHQVLSAFAAIHGVTNNATRISTISDTLKINSFLYRLANSLSMAQRLRLNLARAALSDSPLVLLDDVADHLGGQALSSILPLFAGRCVIIATRHAATADQLKLPLLLLHAGTLTHHGSIEDIATDVSCPRVIDIWVEGLRYDLLRNIRKHKGVLEARLLPTTQFNGQRLRVTLRSSRYLPTLYDLISQAPLIQVQELPATLNDIITRLGVVPK